MQDYDVRAGRGRKLKAANGSGMGSRVPWRWRATGSSRVTSIVRSFAEQWARVLHSSAYNYTKLMETKIGIVVHAAEKVCSVNGTSLFHCLKRARGGWWPLWSWLIETVRRAIARFPRLVLFAGNRGIKDSSNIWPWINSINRLREWLGKNG